MKKICLLSKYNYYKKLVKNFLMVAIFSSTILLIFSSIIFSNKIQKSTNQYNEATLKNSQIEIQKTIETTINIARQLSMNQQVKRYISTSINTDYMDINDINLMCMNLVSNYNFLDSIYVVYPKRNMVVTSYGLFSLDFFIDKAWFNMEDDQRNIPNLTWLGKRNIRKDRLNDISTEVVTLSMKINKNNSSGYVIVNIKEDYLSNKLNNSSIDKGNILVYSEKGELYTSSSEMSQDSIEIVSSEILFKNTENIFFKNLININGRSHIYNVANSDFNWIYIVFTPISIAIQEYISYLLLLILFVFIIIVISYVMALQFGKNAYLPIYNFVNSLLYNEDNTDFYQYSELKNCSSNINSIKKEHENLKNQMNIMRPPLINNVYMELLNGKFSDEQTLIDYFNILQIPYQKYNHHVVATLYLFGDYENIYKMTSLEKYEFFSISILQYIDNICREKRIDFQSVQEDSSTFSLIFCFINDDEDQLKYIIDLISLYINENFGFDFCIGIGSSINNLISLSTSHSQSIQALKQCIFYCENIIYFYEIDNELHRSYINPVTYEKNLTDAIHSYNIDEAIKILNDIRNSIYNSYHDIHIVTHFYVNIVTMAYSLLKDTEIDIQLNTYIDKIFQEKTLLGIHQIVEDACINICRRIEDINIQNRKQLIDTIITYLENNYSLDISLQDVSDKVSYTPTYTNKILKQYLNKTFYELLTEIRINNAKKLLTSTDLQIYQIAEQTGYTNVQSFIRAFKKTINITPGKYRDLKLNELE